MNILEHFEVTTAAGKTYTVDSAITDAQAAQALLADRTATNFALSIANAAKNAEAGARPLSPKQRAWLHILASWTVAKATQAGRPSLDLSNIIALLEHAQAAQKRAPFLALGLGDRTIVIRLARQGHANIVSDGPYESRDWFGKITAEGVWRPSYGAPEGLDDLLLRVANDPARAAAQHGVATGNCCFCARDLSTKESRSVGYGPVCADKFGLPWGTVDADLDAAGKEIIR